MFGANDLLTRSAHELDAVGVADVHERLQDRRASAAGSASSLVQRPKRRQLGWCRRRGEPRREHHRAHHPRDDHPPVLERLTQIFDRVAADLGELAEEQDTVVQQGSLMSPDGPPRAMRAGSEGSPT